MSITPPTTGWPVGFWWAELTHPYWAFTDVGYDVEIRSPEGGALQADAFNDPEHESGYSAHDFVSLGFKKSPRHLALIQDTKSIDTVDPEDYDALFVTGGQSPMVTFRGNEKVQQLVARFFEAGKITALICHATCLLLETRLASGDLLVQGRSWTGFADKEEQFADDFVGRRIQPFWIETEARRIPAPTSLWSSASATSPCAMACSSRANSSSRARPRRVSSSRHSAAERWSMDTIAILGAGTVGRALASRLVVAGAKVCFGVRHPQSAAPAQTALAAGVPLLRSEAAVADAGLILLAVPAAAAVEAARAAGNLKDRVLVDCTNPVRWDDGPVWAPPPEGSVSQALAAALPGVAVVKGFNHFGAEIQADPSYVSGPADALFAGDGADAKRRTMELAARMGFRPHDAGPLRNAALLENLAVLWIHLATSGGKGRQFAFRLEQRP